MDPLAMLAVDSLTQVFIELKTHVEQDGNPLEAMALRQRCHHWEFMTSLLLASGVHSRDDDNN